MVISGIRSIKLPGNVQSKALVARQPVAAFCAVGNPEGFFDLLLDEFDLTNTTAFRDHHRYTQSDIDRLDRKRSQAARTPLSPGKRGKNPSAAFRSAVYVVDMNEISSAERFST